jgi:hypothetical protein
MNLSGTYGRLKISTLTIRGGQGIGDTNGHEEDWKQVELHGGGG